MRARPGGRTDMRHYWLQIITENFLWRNVSDDMCRIGRGDQFGLRLT